MIHNFFLAENQLFYFALFWVRHLAKKLILLYIISV